MDPLRRPHRHPTHITTSDFEHFVGEVAGDIWNTIVHQRPFHHLRPIDYADLFEAVGRALTPYQMHCGMRWKEEHRRPIHRKPHDIK